MNPKFTLYSWTYWEAALDSPTRSVSNYARTKVKRIVRPLHSARYHEFVFADLHGYQASLSKLDVAGRFV